MTEAESKIINDIIYYLQEEINLVDEHDIKVNIDNLSRLECVKEIEKIAKDHRESVIKFYTLTDVLRQVRRIARQNLAKKKMVRKVG